MKITVLGICENVLAKCQRCGSETVPWLASFSVLVWVWVSTVQVWEHSGEEVILVGGWMV
jgi:hypothetical protein